jgi:large subunit ribosomal protein L24
MANILGIKKGDEVVIIAGNDKTRGDKIKSGKILSVDTKKSRVCVEGVNIRKKAIKPNQDHPNGGLIEFEAPIAISNVMLKSKYDQKRAK